MASIDGILASRKREKAAIFAPRRIIVHNISELGIWSSISMNILVRVVPGNIRTIDIFLRHLFENFFFQHKAVK